MACIRGEWKDVWLGTWSSRLATRLQVLCYSPIANQHLSPNFPTTNGHVENQQKHAQTTSLVWDGVKHLQIQKINTVKVLNSLSWMLSLPLDRRTNKNTSSFFQNFWDLSPQDSGYFTFYFFGFSSLLVETMNNWKSLFLKLGGPTRNCWCYIFLLMVNTSRCRWSL